MFPFEQFSLEMVVVLALGLMILGPKDLPVVLRKLGQFVAKMRGMAAEFRASFDELARQSELDELRKEVEALRTGTFGQTASPPADPAYAYKPYDDAAAGLDNSGAAPPPETPPSETVITGEGVPPAEAEYPISQRPRRPRGPRPAPVEEPSAAEAAPEADAAPAKPVRKPRAKKPAAAKTTVPAADLPAVDASAADAAE